jgi:tetratricopeptide (TPR) repeat protein
MPTGSKRQDEVASDAPLSDPGLDAVFRAFKKGVEKQLGAEDYDTRYNLGIAYKEMGLLDEAIAEFQIAAKDEARLWECCSMLGLCFVEKGMHDIAIKWFERGLSLPGQDEEAYCGLRYDLAHAHETIGDIERAVDLYRDIYRVDARFRDVRDRLRALQAVMQKGRPATQRIESTSTKGEAASSSTSAIVGDVAQTFEPTLPG